MIPSPGKLTIRFVRRDGRVEAGLLPPEQPPMGELLAGKSAEEAARLVPLIFSICAAAQAAAARSALGLPAAEGEEMRVGAETLREHVLKLCVVWPTVLGQAASRDAAAQVGRALERPEAASALASAIFAPGDGAPADWPALERWMDAGETAPARAFAAVARGWDPACGRADVALFDPSAPVDWAGATQAGLPVENSPAARVADRPLMTDIAGRLGHGMLWRMAARLIEVAALLGGERMAAVAAPGIANAARGAMLVEAETRAGHVTAFRRLSPTDFALAKGGVLETVLETLAEVPDGALRPIAQMVIETVDPCVETEIEVRDA